jgi:hypothetical protein
MAGGDVEGETDELGVRPAHWAAEEVPVPDAKPDRSLAWEGLHLETSNPNQVPRGARGNLAPCKGSAGQDHQGNARCQR